LSDQCHRKPHKDQEDWMQAVTFCWTIALKLWPWTASRCNFRGMRFRVGRLTRSTDHGLVSWSANAKTIPFYSNHSCEVALFWGAQTLLFLARSRASQTQLPLAGGLFWHPIPHSLGRGQCSAAKEYTCLQLRFNKQTMQLTNHYYKC
jgi:hypothetical protein